MLAAAGQELELQFLEVEEEPTLPKFPSASLGKPPCHLLSIATSRGIVEEN